MSGRPRGRVCLDVMLGSPFGLRFRHAFLAVGVTVSASACAASEDGSDREDQARQSILAPQRSAAAYTEAVQITVNNSFADFCTGVLVAPSVVVTAAHCVVFNPNDDGAGPHGTWIVRAPFASGGTQTRTASSGEPMEAAFYGLNYFDYDSFDQNLHDVALLYLDTPMTGVTYPDFSPARYPIGAAPAVSAVGRQTVNTNAGLVLSKQVTLSQTTAGDGYPNDNKTARVTTGGDSGGPLFLEGTHTLVGTETRFDPTNNLDYWVRLDGSVYDFIANRVASHGGFANTVSIGGFLSAVSSALCSRVAACCAATTPGYVINSASCTSTYDRLGFESTARGLAAAAAGNVTITPGARDACVAAINSATADCTFSSAEMNAALVDCISATTGTVATGGACVSSAECTGNAVCEKNAAGAGTCRAVHAIGASCEVADKSGTVDERYNLAQELCSRRNGGAAYCDAYDFVADNYRTETTWTCRAAVGNGGACGTGAGCTSQVCAPLGTASQFTCVASTPFVTASVCTAFAGP